jgi:hypothetical protein
MLKLAAFSLLFPDLDDLDSFYLPSLQGDLTSTGPYHIFDLYCQDYGCECHKVTMVIADDSQENILATIAYGWKSKSYYYKWGLDKDGSESLTSGFLDPFGNQTVHSSIFLNFIRRKINREPQFMMKIKKRYRMFKNHVDSPSYVPIVPPPQPLPDNVVPLEDYRRERA